MIKLLHEYQNGNYKVSVFSDGTKTRQILVGANPLPEFPELVNVQITNWCDASCAFCHEESNTAEPHGDIMGLGLEVLLQLPVGTEVMLDGGATQKHPDLIPFLRALKNGGLITSIVVNSFHLEADADLLHLLQKEKLVYEVKLSYLKKYHKQVVDFADENTTVSMILGVHTPEILESLILDFDKKRKRLKVELLGYKSWGRGKKFLINNPFLLSKIKEWKDHINVFFDQNIDIVFDNLSVKQLDMKRFFEENEWEALHREKGNYGMYVSFVKNHYSLSSISEKRFPLTSNIRQMFESIKEVL